MYFLLTDTDTTTLHKWRPVGGITETREKKKKSSYKSSSRTWTEENLRVEVKADSDVTDDDRTGKEEMMF